MTRRSFLRRGWGLGALGVGVGVGPDATSAQLADLLGLVPEQVGDTLDPRVLKALRSGDHGQLQTWLKVAADELKGDDVLDLAALEDGADLVLPLLERSPTTQGYASWLRARMDYFEVADFFRDTLPSPRKSPKQPEPPPMTPTPEQERKAWKKQVEQQSQPKGASTWVPRLKPVFRGAGAPSEFVWLAEVESSFDPHARSPAGAAGMYQLMPGTARDLGLKTAPQDERLLPEKSAKAAATYLGRLRRQFGDWRLVLAAYNAGPSRVADTLKRRRARSYDAIAPDLPAETQMYVPKFEAVLQRREGLALAALKA